MIGQTILHYRILEKLGQGGMGEVFLAVDTSLDRKVALKFLPDVFSGDPERRMGFEREARLLACLNHPNLATIHGLEHSDGKHFLAMTRASCWSAGCARSQRTTGFSGPSGWHTRVSGASGKP